MTETTPQSPPRETHTFKRVDGCALQADAIGADAARRAAQPCPAIVWIHGGGLIFGTRTRGPRPTLLQALLRAGTVVLSIDHRLAPETKLAEIVDDVHDAWRWLVASGPALFNIDPTRIAMVGGSSGAYLTLLSGARIRPRLRALVSFDGFGDITLPWEADPSPHYRADYPPVSRNEALASVGTGPVCEAPLDVDRAVFYVWCRQQGRWLAEVTGHDPHAEPRWFDAYCPARQIAADHPPTMLIHGSTDTDVPCDESRRLASLMAGAGVEHELITLEGVGHGLSGATAELAAAIERRAAAFLLDRLTQSVDPRC
jgi:acetyl esterase/lipase